jgi:hypothetical protein
LTKELVCYLGEGKIGKNEGNVDIASAQSPRIIYKVSIRIWRWIKKVTEFLKLLATFRHVSRILRVDSLHGTFEDYILYVGCWNDGSLAHTKKAFCLEDG